MNNLTFPPPVLPQGQAPQKHSTLGIASFAVGILALIFFCLGFVLSFSYGFSLALSDPTAQLDTGSPLVIIASLVMCLCPILNLVGIGLGIASVVQSRDKKVFGIIGLVLNGLLFLTYCLLFGLGLLQGTSTLTMGMLLRS